MAGPAIDFDLENEDTAEFSGLRSDPGVLNMALASAAAEGGGLNPARLAIVGGGAFLLTVIVGSILIFSSGDDAPSDAPLTPAEANEVIGEVEPVGKPSRTGRQWHDLPAPTPR